MPRAEWGAWDGEGRLALAPFPPAGQHRRLRSPPPPRAAAQRPTAAATLPAPRRRRATLTAVTLPTGAPPAVPAGGRGTAPPGVSLAAGHSARTAQRPACAPRGERQQPGRGWLQVRSGMLHRTRPERKRRVGFVSTEERRMESAE